MADDLGTLGRFPTSGPSLRASLLQGGVASVLIKGASVAANLLVTVFLARLLAPTGYGIYSLALALASLLALPIQLGLPTLVVREVPIYAESGQWGALRGLLNWAHALVFSTSSVIACLTVALAWLARSRIGPDFRSTMLLATPLLALTALTGIRQSTLMGLKRILSAQIPELLVLPILYLICLAILSAWGPYPMSPRVTMSAYVGCYLVCFMLGSRLLARRMPAQVRAATPVMRSRAWTRSIVPLSLISGCSMLSAQLMIPILSAFSSEESAGLYRVASSGAALATVVGATIGGLVAPHISTLYTRGDILKLQLLARYTAWACLIPALAALLAFVSFGPVLLRIAFGQQYSGASTALVILAVGQVVNCGTGIVHALLNMTGHERDTLRGSILGTLTNVMLAVVLVPRFGLTGAAIATCTAVAAENVLLYVTVQSRLHIGSSVFSLG